MYTKTRHFLFVCYPQINGKEPLFTNKTKSFSGCIDYIFYKGLVPLSAQIIPNDIE